MSKRQTNRVGGKDDGSRPQEASRSDVQETFALPASNAVGRDLLIERLGFRGNNVVLPARLAHLSEILNCPSRAVVIVPSDHKLARPVTIFDRRSGEFIVFKVRVNQFNRMSLAGVEFIEVDRDAEQWAAERRSGRTLKQDGSIE